MHRTGPDDTVERILQFANKEIAPLSGPQQEEAVRRVGSEPDTWFDAIAAGKRRRQREQRQR